MSRQITTNTFSGLVMDLAPLNTLLQTMTDCLNGTLCTLNGDELTLQNDMGNGRVQTAYLPEGYVPVGTAELGGIIYVAAYNPLTGYSLIGSFPSPCELELDDTKNNSFDININKFLTDNVITRLAVKTQIGDTIFKTGDKFLITGDLSKSYLYIYLEDLISKETYIQATNRFIKYKAAIISDSTIENIKSLEQYTYTINDNKYKFPILDISDDNTVESAAKIKEARYNIYTGNAYGKLVLISELATCESCLLSSEDTLDRGDLDSNVTIQVKGEEKFAPSAVKFKIELYNSNGVKYTPVEKILNLTDSFKEACTDGKSYTIKVENILSTLEGFETTTIYLKLLELKKNNYFFKDNREEIWYIKYTFNPVITYKEGKNIFNYPIEFIAGTHLIDLSQLQSGNVVLNKYLYLNTESTLTIDLGLSVYLKVNLEIKSAILDLYYLNSSSEVQLKLINIPYLNGLSNILIQKTYSELGLVHNTLCYVLITITLTENSTHDTVASFNRWLFTNSLFNKYYGENVLDFDVINPLVSLATQLTTSTPSINIKKEINLGNILSMIKIAPIDTRSTETNTLTIKDNISISYKAPEDLVLKVNKISISNNYNSKWTLENDFPNGESNILDIIKQDKLYNNPYKIALNELTLNISWNNVENSGIISIASKYEAETNYVAYTGVKIANKNINNLYAPLLYSNKFNGDKFSTISYGLDSTYSNYISLNKANKDAMGNDEIEWKYTIDNPVGSKTTNSLKKVTIPSSSVYGEFVQIRKTPNLKGMYIDYNEPKYLPYNVSLFLDNVQDGELSKLLWILKTNSTEESYLYIPVPENNKLIVESLLSMIYRNTGKYNLSYYCSNEYIYTYTLTNVQLNITYNINVKDYILMLYRGGAIVELGAYLNTLRDYMHTNKDFISAAHSNFNLSVKMPNVLYISNIGTISNDLSSKIKDSSEYKEDATFIMDESAKSVNPIKTVTLSENGLGYKDGDTIKALTTDLSIKNFTSYKIGLGIFDLVLNNGILRAADYSNNALIHFSVPGNSSDINFTEASALKTPLIIK